MIRSIFLTLLLLFMCARNLSPLQAQETPTAFKGALLYPIAGSPIVNGLFITQNGKLTYVGPFKKSKIPKNARVLDLSGKTVLPGLVDTHSHIGEAGPRDASNPFQQDTRIWDQINPRAATISKARAGGITTVNIMPGSSNLIAGQTIYVKLREAADVEAMALRNEDGSLAGGLKVANGSNPHGTKPYPQTRSKAMALMRQQFIKAQEYRAKMANPDSGKRPARDLKLEALAGVLGGARITHFHSHRHDDLLSALRLAKEFGLNIVLHHVSEGAIIVDQLVQAQAACSIIVIDSPGGKLEVRNMLPNLGALLEKKGVPTAFHTDDAVTDSRLFLRSAGFAVRHGMSPEKALEGLTLAGARMLGLDHRVGSLEEGKDADFVILSGDPLSVYTQVLETWIEGVQVLDRKNPKDHNYAVGGYGASHDSNTALLAELLQREDY